MDTPAKLLSILLAIEGEAKDFHYAARGDNFAADHALADRIGSGLADFRDALQECVMLARGLEAVPAAVVDMRASTYLQSMPTPIIDIVGTMSTHLEFAEAECARLAALPDCAQGERKLLDDIAADLRVKRGLIRRRLGDMAMDKSVTLNDPDAAPAPSNP